uniref:Sulphur transport domain-containing protein n=1 Tax=Polytomella parva TaxID=51329 RepID=A0A7S0VCB4_9CHLO|mmetsp:Transcript_32756/g.59358  ORF Transcript_32756/g.59358 Transcript_32756/m.59358 type:complete len:362 (+) Transcript_32756:96-1181(+)
MSSLIEGASVVLKFTPQHALLGGSLIGIAAVGKLFLTGRVLGVSGAIKGIVNGDTAPWRPAFLSGLIAGGLALSHYLPSAFEVLPETYTVSRATVGGFLVGLGAALGNGCTSGHGICGNARLSLRSLAFTLMFMASGAASCFLSGAAKAAGIANVAPAFVAASVTDVKTVATTAAAAIAGFSLLGKIGQSVSGSIKSVVEKVATGTSGFVFALGLGFAGMCRPSKVIGFLNLAGPWDPTLMFVMGSAVVISAAGYAAIQKFKVLEKPVVCEAFSISTLSNIDKKLLIGAALFGAGWGIGGICPGPGVVSAAEMSPQVLAYLGSLCLGMVVERLISKAAPGCQCPASSGSKTEGESSKKKAQ